MEPAEGLRREGKPIVDEYASLASVYDKRWAFYIQATVRETIARLPLNPGERLLDVGCGTGALLYRLVKQHTRAQLFGVDAVSEMLGIAQRRLPASTALSAGWAEQLPYRDACFDLVVSCNMFHYIRRPQLALGEMRRVLRPGGRLVLTDWCDDYIACRLVDLYLRWFRPAHFKVYGARELHGMLEEVGYTGIGLEPYRISWLWGLMTATATKPAAQPLGG